MSAEEKKSQKQNNQLLQPDNSEMKEELEEPQQLQQQSRESNIDTTKKKQRQLGEKQSQIKRVIINNRPRVQKIQNQPAYQGIFLYKPGVELPSLYQFCNQTIKIIIATEYIKRSNPQLVKRNIYGTDPYTSNSDAVCILVHSGYININSFPHKRFEGVELTCKVIKPKKNYTGCLKNGLMSRNLKGYNGNALKPQAIKNLQSLGPMENLQRYAANMHIPIGKNRIKPKPKNIVNIIPIPQTHIVFNMNNEPAYKYSIFNIADKGFQKNEFMVKKLQSSVLYLETEDQNKYQLLKHMEMDTFDVYKFSRVKNPQKIDNEYFAQNKCPLEEDQIQVLYQKLDWQEILWGNSSILLRNQKRIQKLRSFKYYKKQKEK